MKNSIVFMSAFVLSVSLATGALASGKSAELSVPAVGPVNVLIKLDANSDGIITREEVEQSQAAQFRKMDGDHNGEATITEINTGIRGLLEPGRLKKRNSFLAKWDANKDGVISTAEIDAAMEKGVDERAKKIGSRFMKTLDIDRNATLSLDEYMEKRLPPFERADTDDDGKVTMVELRALAEFFMKARRSGDFKAIKKSVAKEMNK